MTTIEIDKLVLDYTLYPRHQVDDTNVKHLREALACGATFPPIRADKTSLRITDGFHRYTAYQREGVKVVEVELVDYPDEQAMLLDAVRTNLAHGKRLSPFDVARANRLAHDLGITPAIFADSIGIPRDRLDDIRKTKSAVDPKGKPVPIRAGLRHMAGQKLTGRQVAAAEKIGGHRPLYYARQMIELLESEMMPTDPHVVEDLVRLRDALDAYLAAHLAAA